jgi:GNAT superfamily N-acetyltransferase
MELHIFHGNPWHGGANVIAVRAARPGDGLLLWRTTRMLAESHGHLESFGATANDYERDLFCANPLIGAFIATWNGEAAGTAVWHRSYSTFRGRETIYLEDLSVLPAFRKRGVGRALMVDVAKMAVARGAPAISWLMMDWNENARRLYASLGAEIESGNSYCRLRGDALKALAR